MNDLEETLMLNNIISEILDVVNSNDREEIKIYVKAMMLCVKDLNKNCNIDRFIYNVFMCLCEIVNTFSDDEGNSLIRFYDFLNLGLDEIKYEKQVLKEIRTYLKNCSKSSDCEFLSLCYSIFFFVNKIHGARCKKMVDNCRILNCGLSGIEYIPASGLSDDIILEYKSVIDDGVEVLKRRKD